MAVADEAVTDSDPTAGPPAAAEQGPGLALTGHLGTADEGDLDEPLPNAESLVAQTVGVAGPDHTTASLVSRFWRFAPDEELIGFTAQEMYDAAVAHDGENLLAEGEEMPTAEELAAQFEQFLAEQNGED